MRKIQFEKLIPKFGLILVHTSQDAPRFAVALRNGNKGYQCAVFRFDSQAFYNMTEQEAIKYIKDCKESMKRERERRGSIT